LKNYSSKHEDENSLKKYEDYDDEENTDKRAYT